VLLYFHRHGKATDAGAGGDEARELTAEATAALRAAAGLWRRLNLRPDILLCSPLLRARQTAELLVAGIGLAGPPIAVDELRPGAGWGNFARAFARYPDARRVCFVGHEPDLSTVAQLLTGATSIRMRAGALLAVEFPGVAEPGAGEIAWLIDPDLYAER
jgi:phosphohistidine phosphatase